MKHHAGYVCPYALFSTRREECLVIVIAKIQFEIKPHDARCTKIRQLNFVKLVNFVNKVCKLILTLEQRLEFYVTVKEAIEECR